MMIDGTLGATEPGQGVYQNEDYPGQGWYQAPFFLVNTVRNLHAYTFTFPAKVKPCHTCSKPHFSHTHREAPHFRLLHRDVRRFRGGLIVNADRLCSSMTSRLKSENEEIMSLVAIALPVSVRC